MSAAGSDDDGPPRGDDHTRRLGSEPAAIRAPLPRSITVRPPRPEDESDDGLSAEPTLLRDPRRDAEDTLSAQATLLRPLDPSTVISPKHDQERREERGLAAGTLQSGTPRHPRYREPDIGAVLGSR